MTDRIELTLEEGGAIVLLANALMHLHEQRRRELTAAARLELANAIVLLWEARVAVMTRQELCAESILRKEDAENRQSNHSAHN